MHPGMQSQVDLRKHHHEQSWGGDGIPVELFEILKDDAVKVLHSIYLLIWKEASVVVNIIMCMHAQSLSHV